MSCAIYTKKLKPVIILIIAISSCCLVILAVSIYNGIILLNNPNPETYPVRGIDVSNYQGDIDWKTLSANDISFAFIKATEGSSLVDPRFAFNFSEAQKTGIAVGAYHFFSYDSPAETQAELFIDTVAPFNGMLPPVIDLEFYGNYEKNPPSREYVAKELGIMLNMIERHYGLKPIIYATERSYDLYISGAYSEYDIWIRDVYFDPILSDGREWTFWQYTNRERFEGYNGKERFIDVNVFAGSKEDFNKYPKYSSYN